MLPPTGRMKKSPHFRENPSISCHPGESLEIHHGNILVPLKEVKVAKNENLPKDHGSSLIFPSCFSQKHWEENASNPALICRFHSHAAPGVGGLDIVPSEDTQDV
ncbi:unnamed protein product [Caretta caretta]